MRIGVEYCSAYLAENDKAIVSLLGMLTPAAAVAAFELGKMIDDDDLPASGIETEGRDTEERRGAKHESPTAESGDAQ